LRQTSSIEGGLQPGTGLTVDQREPAPSAPVLIGQDPSRARQEPWQRVRRDLLDAPARHDEHLADGVVGTGRIDPPQRIRPDRSGMLVEQPLKELAALDVSHACPMSTTDAGLQPTREQTQPRGPNVRNGCVSPRRL